jgi:hypothetical protein
MNWVPPDTRQDVVDYVAHCQERTELPLRKLIGRLGVGTSKFYEWRERYGKADEHNAQVPRDDWLLDEEKQAILDYHHQHQHPLDGYRRMKERVSSSRCGRTSTACGYFPLEFRGNVLLFGHSWVQEAQ